MRPIVKIMMAGNVWTRQMAFITKGDAIDGHAHTYDHITLVTNGKFKVIIDGADEYEVAAPDMVYVVKNKQHQFIALEDNSMAFCVHAIRDNVGDIIPEGSITFPNDMTDLDLHKIYGTRF